MTTTAIRCNKIRRMKTEKKRYSQTVSHLSVRQLITSSETHERAHTHTHRSVDVPSKHNMILQLHSDWRRRRSMHKLTHSEPDSVTNHNRLCLHVTHMNYMRTWAPSVSMMIIVSIIHSTVTREKRTTNKNINKNRIVLCWLCVFKDSLFAQRSQYVLRSHAHDHKNHGENWFIFIIIIQGSTSIRQLFSGNSKFTTTNSMLTSTAPARNQTHCSGYDVLLWQ